MIICRICKKGVSNGIPLSTGGMIHKSCLQSLQNEEMEAKNLLNRVELHLKKLKNDLARRNSLTYKLVSLFSKSNLSAEEIEEQIAEVNKKTPQLSTKHSRLKNELSIIYDFLTTYPPDWNDRRIMVVQRDGEFCDQCGTHRKLHLHHIISLGRGGSNKISNLKFLCEKCHSKQHGGRNFSDEFNESESAF